MNSKSKKRELLRFEISRIELDFRVRFVTVFSLEYDPCAHSFRNVAMLLLGSKKMKGSKNVRVCAPAEKKINANRRINCVSPKGGNLFEITAYGLEKKGF